MADTNNNHIFERLNADSDDLECLVAYALYKRHKREWAAEFFTKKGKKPERADDEAFAEAVGTDANLDRYRQDAQNLIISFANQVLEESKPEIEVNAITARIEAAASTITGVAAFSKQVLSGLVASIITTAILVILTIAIGLFGVDLLDGVTQFISNEAVSVPENVTK